MWIYILQISNSKYFSINTFLKKGKKYPVMINQIQLQRTIVLYKKKRQNEN